MLIIIKREREFFFFPEFSFVTRTRPGILLSLMKSFQELSPIIWGEQTSYPSYEKVCKSQDFWKSLDLTTFIFNNIRMFRKINKLWRQKSPNTLREPPAFCSGIEFSYIKKNLRTSEGDWLGRFKKRVSMDIWPGLLRFWETGRYIFYKIS